jgi:hypothetical protein
MASLACRVIPRMNDEGSAVKETGGEKRKQKNLSP